MCDLNSLRKRYEKAQRDHAIAEARYEDAQKQLRKTLAEMKESFGVATLKEAKKKLEDLTAERDALRAEIEQKLDDAGV